MNNDVNTHVDLYTTGAAAREVGCSEATLLRYEKVGIITPQRLHGGQRVFTQSQIEIARAQRAKWNAG